MRPPGSGIMPGGGRGREPLVVRDTVQRSGVVAFLCGVTSSRDGRGARPGAASLTLARGAWAAPVT